MGLVEEEDGAQAGAVGGLDEVLLELAHERGIGAGGREAGGAGDLAAHVALGEAGHLDVVGAVAGLGEMREDGAQEGGLAGAGRRDEGAGHARLEGAQDGLERLLEAGEREAVLDGDLAREGGGVEAEAAAEVLDFHHGVSSG